MQLYVTSTNYCVILSSFPPQLRYEIHFGQIYLARPSFAEADGSTNHIFPQDCRIRNLTYAAPLFCDMTHRKLTGHEDPDSMTGEMQWVPENVVTEPQRVTLGRVSIRVFL